MEKVAKIIINSKKYGKKEILIDSSDYDLVSKYNWTLFKNKYNEYAFNYKRG